MPEQPRIISERIPEQKIKKKRVELSGEEYNILEVGRGGNPFFFGELGTPGINLGDVNYIGMDLKEETDPVNLERLKKAIEKKGFPIERVNFLGGKGEELPFKDEIFDEVIFKNVFGEPWPQKFTYDSFLKEASRVLKEKGRMIIIETNTPDIARDFFKKTKLDQDKRFLLVENRYRIEDIAFGGSLERAKSEKRAFMLTLKKILDEKTA